MQCIYWDVLTQCVWQLAPRHELAFRKNSLNGYHCMDFWHSFDELWLLNERRTIWFLSHILNNSIIRNNHKQFETILHKVLFLGNHFNNWPHDNGWFLFPLNFNVPLGFALGEHWSPRGDKTHYFPWGQSLSAQWCTQNHESIVKWDLQKK